MKANSELTTKLRYLTIQIEHWWPGGFKDYVNKIQNGGVEVLTDNAVLVINVVVVWVQFGILAFLALATKNVGFGLVMIIFSIINCVSHIKVALERRTWNPGLVVASIQFCLSIIGAVILTMAMNASVWEPVEWWFGSLLYAVIVHVIMFKTAMKRPK